MAFERYGVGFFDGIVFYPSDWTTEYVLNDKHSPARPYHTDWNWLHRVWEKFRGLRFDDPTAFKWLDRHDNYCREFQFAAFYLSIEEAFLELGKGLEWYYSLKK